MRAVSMCGSFLQVPRCGLHTVANSWYQSFPSLSAFQIFASKTYGVQRKQWIRRPITTKAEGRNKTASTGKSVSIRQTVLGKTVAKTASIEVPKFDTNELEKVPLPDIRQEITKNKELVSLVTVIVFDIETTGFSRENDRIIEIGLQDLRGGINSTFQALVNPERDVRNSHIHGIETSMVSKPDVPRMKELIPILLEYVGSRQKPGGYVLFVAHNARSFDVPFIIHEFKRWDAHIPPNWLFLDTLPLARELMKSAGSKLNSKLSSSSSLPALREMFGIELIGTAHRAMVDVNTLSLVLQKLTFYLKLSLANLIERSFVASEVNAKKKKLLEIENTRDDL